MKVGLYVDNNYTEAQGPGKLYKNLRKGLEKLGHTVVENERGDLTGCLHYRPDMMALPDDVVIGPNIVVTPDQKPEVFSKFKRSVVPSKWVRDKYKTFGECSDVECSIWSVGIDTDEFRPAKHGDPRDGLLYYKNRPLADWSKATQLFKDAMRGCVVLEYGKYDSKAMAKYSNAVGYAMVLSGTESQGIALMEIMATGTPVFVLNQPKWNEFDSTSAPYFDGRCGKIAELNDPGCYSEWEDFLGKVDSYSPRDYIMENHTLEKSAQKYLDILTGANNG